MAGQHGARGARVASPRPESNDDSRGGASQGSHPDPAPIDSNEDPAPIDSNEAHDEANTMDLSVNDDDLSKQDDHCAEPSSTEPIATDHPAPTRPTPSSPNAQPTMSDIMTALQAMQTQLAEVVNAQQSLRAMLDQFIHQMARPTPQNGTNNIEDLVHTTSTTTMDAKRHKHPQSSMLHSNVPTATVPTMPTTATAPNAPPTAAVPIAPTTSTSSSAAPQTATPHTPGYSVPRDHPMGPVPSYDGNSSTFHNYKVAILDYMHLAQLPGLHQVLMASSGLTSLALDAFHNARLYRIPLNDIHDLLNYLASTLRVENQKMVARRHAKDITCDGNGDWTTFATGFELKCNRAELSPEEKWDLFANKTPKDLKDATLQLVVRKELEWYAEDTFAAMIDISIRLARLIPSLARHQPTTTTPTTYI